MLKELLNLLLVGFVLLVLLVLAGRATASPVHAYPGQVQIRGRQHFAVQGQPLRNWARWWFGSVPVQPKPVQPQ
jgi:hypothetical protein